MAKHHADPGRSYSSSVRGLGFQGFRGFGFQDLGGFRFRARGLRCRLWVGCFRILQLLSLRLNREVIGKYVGIYRDV